MDTKNALQGKIEALTEFIDPDDTHGNFLMAYLIANIDDIQEEYDARYPKS